MMRSILLLVLIPNILLAQKWVGANDHADVDVRHAVQVTVQDRLPNDTSELKDHLRKAIPDLQGESVDLIVSAFRQSPKGMHYLFHQTLHGRRVFRGTVKLNLDRNGRVLSIFNNTFPVGGTESSSFPDHTAYHDGLAAHYQTPHNGKLHHYVLQEVYFPVNGILEPAIRLEVVETTDRYYELILDRSVKVIYQNDLLSYAAPEPQDTTITVWVFNPDPLTSSGQIYGAPYADADDADVLELNAERIPAQVSATFESGMFYLKNEHVSIEELSPPTIDPATSDTNVFNFTRAEPGFEDVNAFYHITRFQQYIRSLGFTDIVNYQIAVDAHALSGSDNSNFNSGFNPPRLQFGEGGVDDAEDADVIIHEYGHAIMHAAAPNTNNGTERKTLDEAVGDYFAASYSRHLNSARWQDVFTWDGHNEYWPGRSAVSTDHYPEDLNNNIYSDADIWSATLMQIWGDIGREATDAIMIQAAYSFSPNMTMSQAALLFLQADTLLYNGAHFTPIRQRMFDRGLIPWNVGIDRVDRPINGITVYNSAGFRNGTGAARVQTDAPAIGKLYNTLGQLLHTSTSENGRMEIRSDNLLPGVYVLEVRTEKQRSAVKLIRN